MDTHAATPRVPRHGLASAYVRPFEAAPRPRGLPFLGNVDAVLKDPLDVIVEGFRDHGDFVRYAFGAQKYLLVSDPSAIHHVLVENAKNYTKSRNYAGIKLFLGEGLLTSEGDFWRRQRKLAQPAFHRSRLAGLADRMAAATAAMLDRWAALPARAQAFDVHAEMMRLTFQIVGQTLFSADVDADSDAIGKALAVGLKFADDYASSIVRIPPWVPTPENQRFRRALADLDHLVLRIIGDRRRTERDEGDLLGMLMAARDEATGEGMSDRHLRDEIATLVLAGHETTANALSWTFLLLSRNPTVERALHAEVREVLGDRTPTFDDVPKLRFTRMVLEEAMRLYPPAWAFEREAIAEDVIGGYRVPAGCVIGLSPYVVHRHPAHWENPEGFDPERFTPERSEGRHKHAYLPFGGGPRQCIGNGFAMMEAQIILAMVTQRQRLELVPGHPVAMEAVITLRPKHGIRMSLHPRAPALRSDPPARENDGRPRASAASA